MKNFIVVLGCLLLVSQISFAQIYLDNEGNAGVGIQTSPNARMTINNSTELFGLKINHTTTINDDKVGVYVNVDRNGDGNKIGLRGTIRHTGIYEGRAFYADVVNEGSGQSTGITSTITGGQGIKRGTYTSITQHAISANTFGYVNSIYHYSSGEVRGISTEIANEGVGTVYGEIINLRNNSTGNAYGLYSDLLSSTGTGKQVGIFSRVQSGTDNKAADFVGKVYIDGEVVLASDANLKENIEELTGALDIVTQIKPRTYQYKNLRNHGNNPNINQYGFLAQELSSVLPEVVSKVTHRGTIEARETTRTENGVTIQGTDYVQTTPDEDILAVNYTALIPILTQAIKEQQELIESLTERITELENN